MVRNSTPHGARDINVVLRMSILNMTWAFLKLVHSFLDHTPSIIVCWVYRCCQIVAWSHFRCKVPFFPWIFPPIWRSQEMKYYTRATCKDPVIDSTCKGFERSNRRLTCQSRIQTDMGAPISGCARWSGCKRTRPVWEPFNQLN